MACLILATSSKAVSNGEKVRTASRGPSEEQYGTLAFSSQILIAANSSLDANRFHVAIWAGMLFLGFHLLGGVIDWLSSNSFGIPSNEATAIPWGFPDVLLAIPFALLVGSYLIVRRSPHPVLSQLWVYAIVVGALGLASGPILASLDSSDTLGWGATAFGLARFAALVWFAQRVSMISFGHSLLFIGLVSVLESPSSFYLVQLQSNPRIEWSTPIFVTLVTGALLLRGFAVWALFNVRTIVSSSVALVLSSAVMIVSVAVLFGLSTIFSTPDGLRDMLLVGLAAASSLIAPALALAVTYAIRIRGRACRELQPTQV